MKKKTCDREEKKSQQVVCYRVGSESRALNLEKRRRHRKTSFHAEWPPTPLHDERHGEIRDTMDIPLVCCGVSISLHKTIANIT